MKNKLYCARKAVWEDLKNIKWALLLLLVYYGITRLVFGEFCPVRIGCGLPCPGCGATRAGFFVLTFRWKEAWEMNPTIFLWIFYILFWLWQRYFGKKRRKLSNILLVLICVAAVTWYVVGMTEYFPNREPYTYYQENLIQRCYPVFNR